jgi:hypothetical protein
MATKRFDIRAVWDAEASVWRGRCDALSLATETPTLGRLFAHVRQVAPEIAVKNGLAAAGDEIALHLIAEIAD